jgi:hypothetical protein
MYHILIFFLTGGCTVWYIAIKQPKEGDKMKNMVDLVVTRHPALVEYLRELGLVGDEDSITTPTETLWVTGRR